MASRLPFLAIPPAMKQMLSVGSRIRRVKCDETHPDCMRCISTGRKCDGYKVKTTELRNLSSRTLSPNPPTTLPALPNFDDPQQREFFGFFVSCTSRTSSLYFGANFWSRRVLQLSLGEDSIRYALCSLSALHRMSTASTLPGMSCNEYQQYALQQYNHAVRCTQKLLAESSDGSEDKVLKGLVACILFVSYENILGNYKTAQMHLQNGLQIIAKDRHKRPISRIPSDVLQVFERLDLQSMTFADSMAPYPYHLCHEPMELPKMPTGFTAIEESITFVLDVFRWICRKAASWEPSPIPTEELDAAHQALKQWDSDIDRLLTQLHAETTDEICLRMKLLKMYQVTTTIIIATGVYGQETLHDDHLSKYQQVIAWGEDLFACSKNSTSTPSRDQFLSFDIGVITPLFFAAIKCRDPMVRRRAISLLASNNLQEGSWNSVGAAKVAEFVMGIEEEGLPPEFSQHQVLETARVHLVQTATDVERREIGLSCLLCSENEPGYSRDGQVSYAEAIR